MAAGVVYVRPRITGETLRFGVSGKLWHGALVMYDRRTGSLWSQHHGRALAGPLAGERLKVIESEVTDWRDWRERYPETTVMRKAPAEHARPWLGWATVLGALLMLFFIRRWSSLRPNPPASAGKGK